MEVVVKRLPQRAEPLLGVYLMEEVFLLGEQYRLLKPLRELRAATIYSAQDVTSGQKFLAYILRAPICSDAAFREQLYQNMDKAKEISHPALASVCEAGYERGYCYVLYDYAEGIALREIIRQEAPLPTFQALEIAIQLCEGLWQAHSAGLIHGNFSPEEIIITPEGAPKLLGLGIPLTLYQLGPSYHEWLNPVYLAPEQLRRERMSFATDVYIMGAILFEMLSGRFPFEEGDISREEAFSLREINPAVPPVLEQIIYNTLAPEPAVRYRNAHQLGEVLRAQLETVEELVYPEEVIEEAEEVEGGVDWVALVLGLVALLAVLGMVILWTIVYHRYSSVSPAL